MLTFPQLICRLSALLVTTVLSMSSAHAALVLEYDFNTNSTSQTSTGTVATVGSINGVATIGSAGSGVSGSTADLAFDNTAASSMGSTASAGTSTGIFQLPDVSQVRGLSTFTFATWYRPDNAVISDGARLADYGSNWLSFADAAGRLRIEIPAGTSQSAPSNSFPETDEWVFVAMTFDDATDTVIYYKGTTSSGVTDLVTRTSYTNPMGDANTLLQFGNNNGLNRPLDGYLDNIRVWDEVLSESQLESFRVADVNFVPEPSSAAFLGMSMMVWIISRRRKTTR